jgi:hypothetical protein
MRKRTCDASVEISGQTLQAYTHSAYSDIILNIFQKHGLVNITPDKWYPLSPLLDALYEIGTHPDASSSMVSIGVKIAEYWVEPPDLKTARLPMVLEGWEKHLYANVRNGDVGHITTEKINDTSYRIIHQNVFPDDLCYGLAYGFARAHLPPGTDFKVWYEDYEHRIDNDNSDKTVVCVSWERIADLLPL